MNKKKKVIVIMPAYNAVKTLKKTWQAIPKDLIDGIVIVDDASKDKTSSIAKKLTPYVITHKKNKGYGGNQKTCYKEALRLQADIVVMLHPDYQYNPKHIDYLIQPIRDGDADVMLGSRVRSREEVLKGGMPLYKYIGNRFLTLIENITLGLSLSEYHTGYRAFSRKALQEIPFNTFSDNFVFDQQVLISARALNLRIGEFYTDCRYFKEASSINFIRSVKYGIDILWNLIIYSINKDWFRSKLMN